MDLCDALAVSAGFALKRTPGDEAAALMLEAREAVTDLRQDVDELLDFIIRSRELLTPNMQEEAEVLLTVHGKACGKGVLSSDS